MRRSVWMPLAGVIAIGAIAVAAVAAERWGRATLAGLERENARLIMPRAGRAAGSDVHRMLREAAEAPSIYAEYEDLSRAVILASRLVRLSYELNGSLQGEWLWRGPHAPGAGPGVAICGERFAATALERVLEHPSATAKHARIAIDELLGLDADRPPFSAIVREGRRPLGSEFRQVLNGNVILMDRTPRWYVRANAVTVAWSWRRCDAAMRALEAVADGPIAPARAAAIALDRATHRWLYANWRFQWTDLLAADREGRAWTRRAILHAAARLYELEHAGARPRSVADLVPAYLPAPPLDPRTDEPLPLEPAPFGP